MQKHPACAVSRRSTRWLDQDEGRPAALPFFLPLRGSPFSVDRSELYCLLPFPGRMHHLVHFQLEEDFPFMRSVLGVVEYCPPQGRIFDTFCSASDVKLRTVFLWLRKGLEG